MASKESPEVKPFATVLLSLGRGATERELSEALHDLVARVRDTRKKGVLVYTLEVAPLKGESDALMLSDGIKLKLPEHDRSASIFFADRDGNLVRDDPNQPSLFGQSAGSGPNYIDVSDLAEAREHHHNPSDRED
jgi:hypothetical protein